MAKSRYPFWLIAAFATAAAMPIIITFGMYRFAQADAEYTGFSYSFDASVPIFLMLLYGLRVFVPWLIYDLIKLKSLGINIARASFKSCIAFEVLVLAIVLSPLKENGPHFGDGNIWNMLYIAILITASIGAQVIGMIYAVVIHAADTRAKKIKTS